MQFDIRLKKYIDKKVDKNWKLSKAPNQKKYDSFIIVPAKAESENIPELLHSISKQIKKYLDKCLTIIVINSSTEDSKEIKDDNNKTIDYLSRNQFDFDLAFVNANNMLPLKNAGVGLSRKIGADIVLDYCKESSIICYTDADSILSKDYLKSINQYYNNEHGCAMVSFKHQANSDPIIDKNIRLYEKFLMKTAEDLMKTGSPYGYISLGSCMTCTVSGYIAVGGMNKLKATEDFYFLQELTKHFGYMGQINNIIVYPSSRISERVYLGTGYRMQQVKKGDSIDQLYFSDEAFIYLKKFLAIIKDSYQLNIDDLLNKTKSIPNLNIFLINHDIEKIWKSLINNVDDEKYLSQFHRWFDALKTIKFLKYFSN